MKTISFASPSEFCSWSAKCAKKSDPSLLGVVIARHVEGVAGYRDSPGFVHRNKRSFDQRACSRVVGVDTLSDTLLPPKTDT
jgi:hypothetical protein